MHPGPGANEAPRPVLKTRDTARQPDFILSLLDVDENYTVQTLYWVQHRCVVTKRVS